MIELITTSVAENTHSINSLRISPNPSTTTFTITLSLQHPGTLILYDITGRALLQQPFNTQVQLNLSGFSAGMYVIEVRDKDGRSVKGKVVKK